MVVLLFYVVVVFNGGDFGLVGSGFRFGMFDYLIGLLLCLVVSVFVVCLGVFGGWMMGVFLMSVGFNVIGIVVLVLFVLVLILCFIVMGVMIGCWFKEMILGEFVGVFGVLVVVFVVVFLVLILGVVLVLNWIGIFFG